MATCCCKALCTMRLANLDRLVAQFFALASSPLPLLRGSGEFWGLEGGWAGRWHVVGASAELPMQSRSTWSTGLVTAVRPSLRCCCCVWGSWLWRHSVVCSAVAGSHSTRNH